MRAHFDYQTNDDSSSRCRRHVLFVCAVLTCALLAAGKCWSGQQTEARGLAAPFSADMAKSAQRRWATKLGDKPQTTNSIGMPLVVIPPGEFMMGSPENEVSLWDEHQEDETLHRVRLTRPFRIGVYPVRVRDFQTFVCQAAYRTSAEKDPRGGWGFVGGRLLQDRRFSWRDPGFEQSKDSPVVNVSWNDANEFCKWLSKKEGKRYRLPTEAEWEYACRAGTVAPFYFGGSCNGSEANCNGNHPYGTDKKGPYLQRTSAVGSYAPNAFGLYDMSGNAHEWCSDWYDVHYSENSPVDDPLGPATGKVRAMRSGGWYNFASVCRSADRGSAEPGDSSLDLGFRVVREEKEK